MATTAKKPDFSVSLEELLEAGAHFGHAVRRWNPKMRQFIWAQRDGVHIFDLAKTAQKLEEASQALYDAAASGKTILVIGTKRQAKELVKAEAQKIGVPFVSERWLGGMISNWQQIRQQVKRLADLKSKKEKGELGKYTKKEQMLFDREIEKLERFFGGLANLTQTPQVVLVIDTHKERVAVREARGAKALIIGITDTNANPDLVDYPVPANDDAVHSVELVVTKLMNALAAGVEAYKRAGGAEDK